MIPPTILAVWNLPDSLITGLAVAVAGGIGWIIKHLTTRSGERALLLRTSADTRATENATVVARAIQGFESQVAGYQRELEGSRAEVIKLREEQNVKDREYMGRIIRVERKVGRMHSFILEIYTAYVNIRAYAGVLDVKLSLHVPDWKPKEFPDIKLPNFEDDGPHENRL